MNGDALPLGGGIVSALVTPFDAGGQVDTGALDALIDFQVERSVDGLFVLGTSGEGLLLSPAERGKVVEQVLARAGDRIPVAVHCGAADTATATELVSDAAGAGARTVAAIPPLFFAYNDQGIRDHFERLAEAAPGIDHYLYDNPARVGYSIGADLARRLVDEVPCIRGVKDTGDSLGRITTYLATRSEMRVFTGNNVIVLGALVMGAVGAVSTTANAVPELFAGLYAAFQSGDLAKARDLQLVAARLQEALAGLPYIAAAKHLLAMRKLPGGHTHAPLPELADDQRTALDGRVTGDPTLASWLAPVS
ncbi:MAG: dihydrodipicolinate synthase family protein [Streptosporangiales bacterium]